MSQEAHRRRLPGVVWALAIILAMYLALGWLFDHETRVRGLLAPNGSPNLDVVAVGGIYLLARIAVRFGVPFMASLAAAQAIARKLGSMRGRS